MKGIALLVAAAAAYLAVQYFLQLDSERTAKLADEELKGLKEHFKSLDQV